MALRKTLSILAVLACMSVAVAAVGQQPAPTVSVGPNRVSLMPASGICIDSWGFGSIPDHLHASQPYGMYIDPYGFGTIPEPTVVARRLAPAE